MLIIGGGILGCAAARELSRYKVDVTLVEKEVDFGWGSTKATATLVCQGEDCLEFRKEYQRSKFVWGSIPLMEPLCEELDVPFKRIGELGIIRNNADREKFQKMKSRAEKWIPDLASHQWVDRDTLLQMEPNVTKEAIGALYDHVIAVTDPVRLTMALAENANQNGVNLMLGTKVLAITPGINEFEVQTSQGVIKSQFIVNAAGVFADKIAAMVNADDFILFPVKAYIGILDKKVGGLISHMVYAQPSIPGEMNVVLPSIHGNLFFGIQLQLSKRGDYATTREMARVALRNAQGLLPDISERDMVTSFVGYLMLRNFEIGWHESVVRASDRVPRFINLSIGYPGVSAAPAAAKEVVEVLAREGLKLVGNPGFNLHRQAIIDIGELSDTDKRNLIAENPQYGHVVCRCETVTEGEIVEAIRRGATTMDGVKFRVRPGMGRCQGGFCGPRVIDILARELNIPKEQVTKKGPVSRQLLFKSKELLRRNKHN